MFEKLRCKIFGHDFRRIIDKGEMIYSCASKFCRNCGLSKKEVLNLHKNKSHLNYINNFEIQSKPLGKDPGD